ncbi:glutathione exchanger [Stylosanthes scabra]|uniref:Glutathione exchanger n=1 Tax=Stylosanthes scabra TaxID=79078 RepID=A0ABU6SVB0_9FABA|nr:glutathione exchanger [Stylosanthes scabra]
MEVNDGLLVTNLPSGLINTTELKHKNSYQWQPLQTYVTISKHFMVKATGIRFQGTVNDCNGVMEQLFFHGGEHGAVLTLTLNDMGNHGCYPNCAEGMSSMPLYTEATVILMRKQLMSPFLAHTLGSIIVIEFVVMFSLGLLLLYFTCKCAILLLHERRNHHKSSSEQSPHQISSMNVTENTTYFTGCCSRSSNFRQR